MGNDHQKTPTGQKVVAGIVATGLFIVLLVGLVTGDISHSRHPFLKRSSDPEYFWAYMSLLAVAGVYAVLLALGLVKPKPQPDYVAGLARQTASTFTFLALLGSAGSGYFWISELLSGHPSLMSEIAGWIALAMAGLAAWPPLVAPGAARMALRAAGTAAILLATIMIYRLLA